MTATMYKVEVFDGTRWWVLTGGVSRPEARGYLWAIKDGPTPRRAYRVVRVSDGKVVDGLAAVDTAHVGQSAGSPPTEQLLTAAYRVLAQAGMARPVEPETVYKRWEEVANVATTHMARWAVKALAARDGE